MDVLLLIGRIFLVLVFLGSSVAHLTQPAAIAGYSQFRGRTIGNGMAVASGVWILAGGLSVALGIFGDLGALMLIAFLLSAAFLVHHFWTDTDANIKSYEMSQFMKNIGISGGLLIAFVLFQREAAGWTLTGPLF